MQTSIINGIPVFEALLGSEDDGMVRISLVDSPAVLTNWQAFAEEKQPQKFAIESEDQRLVRGVIMRSDFPIYRRDPDGYEFYLIYRADTIRQMAEKYLAENRQNRIDTDHDGNEVRGVNMVQFYIKDTAAGVNPSGFEDVADGSLFAEFHVTDDMTWEAIKAGIFTGFSLEGYFDIQPETDQKDIDAIVDELAGKFSEQIKTNRNNIVMKIAKTLDRLRELLEANPMPAQKFGRVTTDKGIISWEGEEDLKAGDRVNIIEADGNEVAAADGEYMTDDGKTIVVAGGIVAEIRDPEAEVAPDDEQQDTRVSAEAQKVSDQFTAQRVQMEESYDEKYRKIADAIRDYLATNDFYIVEAGDDFAVAEVWNVDGEKYFRFAVTWDEEGNASVSNPVEVKKAFVPVDEDTEAAFEELRSQLNDAIAANTTLETERDEALAELEKLKAQPAAKPAHEEVREASRIGKTGNKAIDRLNELMGR